MTRICVFPPIMDMAAYGCPVLLLMQFSQYFLSGLLSGIQDSIPGHQD